MAPTKGSMQVLLQGRGLLTLRPSDYKATGGEGSIYRAAATAIKIYNDPKKMEHDGMPEKIKLLSALAHKYIIAPQELVFDPSSGKPLGFYMPYVEGEPMPRIFTNDFRQRTGFTNEDAKTLVARTRETVQFAHSNGATLVDANELNWLATLMPNDPKPYVIDVDSWAIDRWKASVIMPSIRDWHTKGFSHLSDWFSWGIVTFQVFTGIHPYKGALDGFKPGDFEERMKANKSVFTNGVRLNRAVRDFSCIPGPLLDWYRAAFEHSERVIPPSPFESGVAVSPVARVLHAITTTTGALIFEKIFGKIGNSTIRMWPCGVVLLASGEVVELTRKKVIGRLQTREGEIVKVKGGWLTAERVGTKMRFVFINESNFTQEVLAFSLDVKQMVRYQDRLFVVTDRGLTEVACKLLGKPILSIGNTWGVLTHATHWFDGVGIEDAMGAMFVVAPFSDDACASIRVRELDRLQPITAKAGNRFITIIGVDKNGAYQKLELTFDRDYKTYMVWQGGTDSPDLNTAILPKGVCATIVQDGELDIFVPTSGQLTKIADKYITTDMTLASWEDKVMYLQNGEVWSVRMK